jgi:hypothetical protein
MQIKYEKEGLSGKITPKAAAKKFGFNDLKMYLLCQKGGGPPRDDDGDFDEATLKQWLIDNPNWARKLK